jgi:signal transduction histidine kinase
LPVDIGPAAATSSGRWTGTPYPGARMTTSDADLPVGHVPAGSGLARSSVPGAEAAADGQRAATPNHGSQTSSTTHRVDELLAANQSIVGELSLPLVLRRIVAAAAKVSGARYAALGVLGADGKLEQFLHTGMDELTVSRIGDLPHGRGVLGAVIDHPEPIRLDRIADDSRSSGFPPGHPPMVSFLGVPVRGRDLVYGNLYLTDRRDGRRFTDEDIDLVEALAATASIAIENARRYEEARRRQQWLQVSTTITRELLTETAPGLAVLVHIADSVQELASADVVTLVLPTEGDPDQLEIVVVTGLGAQQLKGSRFAAQHSLADQVMTDGQGVLLGAGGERPWSVHLDSVVPSGPVMAVPLTGNYASRGAIVLGRIATRATFNESDLAMAGAFAEQAALALELSEARADRQRLSVLEDRDRIGRDLHDHVIQRLFASGLGAQALIADSPDAAVREGLTRIVAELSSTIRQIRSTIFALRDSTSPTPSVRRTVGVLMGQLTPVLGFRPEVSLSGPLDTLVEEPVRSDVEAVLREALTNVGRHAGASAASVTVEVDSSRLVVIISDNGCGIQGEGIWSGLANLRARAEGHGGSLLVDSQPEGGLRLRWTVPITL